MHTVSSAGGGGSGQKIFAICQHALDPGLTLHAHSADKLLMQELHNIIYKQHPQTPQSLFNTLTRVGARALHGSKIKD